MATACQSFDSLALPIRRRASGKGTISPLAIAVVLCSAAWSQNLVISTYAGGVPPPTPAGGVNVSLGYTYGVVADAAGNVYFASVNCVFKLGASGTITRIAGTSRYGYSGDGGPAVNAQLSAPVSLAFDNVGNLYIGEDFRVRKISPDGMITTFAGTSVYGYGGDGGPALQARLTTPYGLTFDGVGNLYLTDFYNHRVRRISSTGIITTVAGNGLPGFLGDGGLGINAELNQPSGITLDRAGNLYIADQLNARVREISRTGVITTFAGNGECCNSGDGGPAAKAKLSFPQQLTVDAAGNLYIVDGSLVRKVSTAGIITTVVGGGTVLGDNGPAVGAQLDGAFGLALDATGNIYVSDGTRVRKVSLTGTITTVAGNGTSTYSGDQGLATGAQLSSPATIALDRVGNLYFADNQNYIVRKVSSTGIITTVAGTGQKGYSGDGGPAVNAQLGGLVGGMAVDSAGLLYITDTYNARIRRISATGIITTAPEIS